METSRDTLVALRYQWGQENSVVTRVPVGHPGDAGVSQVLPLGPPGHTVVSLE